MTGDDSSNNNKVSSSILAPRQTRIKLTERRASCRGVWHLFRQQPPVKWRYALHLAAAPAPAANWMRWQWESVKLAGLTELATRAPAGRILGIEGLTAGKFAGRGKQHAPEAKIADCSNGP